MRKTKILVVDDNKALVDIMYEYLVSNGYDVDCFDNGQLAKDKFPQVNPDIVVTDIIMPEVDGIELLLTMRKSNPKIKIIVISGGNKGHAGSYLQMADKLGADATLRKPFEMKKLLEHIKELEAAL